MVRSAESLGGNTRPPAAALEPKSELAVRSVAPSEKSESPWANALSTTHSPSGGGPVPDRSTGWCHTELGWHTGSLFSSNARRPPVTSTRTPDA